MKRYSLTIDLYMFAESDEEAIAKSNELVRKQQQKHDNQASIIELHETPFASLAARKVDIRLEHLNN